MYGCNTEETKPLELKRDRFAIRSSLTSCATATDGSCFQEAHSKKIRIHFAFRGRERALYLEYRRLYTAT